MKSIKSELDHRFEKCLKEFAGKLFEFNQEALKEKEENVKMASCSIIERIDSYLSDMEEM